MNARASLPLIALLLVAACSGATKPEAEEPEAAPEPAAPPPIESLSGPPKPWEEMTFDERKKYMGEHVMPALGPWFETYDAERFADFSCDGCHGPDMVERKFAMPNPSIMALHPTGTAEQKQMVVDHPEMVKFMFNQVLPAVRTLIGAPTYDAETQQGFSCYACHPSAAAAPAATAEGT